MKTIINYTINDGIFIKFGDLDRDLRMKLCKFYFFTEKKSFSEKPVTINLVSLVDYCGEKCLKFPPNESYFKDCITKIGCEVGEASDFRALPKIEGLTTTISLRENQVDMLQKLEKVGYNGLITSKTGFGKTLISIYIAQLLKTPMLFIASRTSLIENLLKDCQTFGVDSSLITKVDMAWLLNPIITPIMYATTSALNNEDIMKKLEGKIGLKVADEIHMGCTSEVARNTLYKVNSKYNIYLSATPDNLKFENLTEAVLSNNIITSEEVIDFDIELHTLCLKPTFLMYDRFYQTKNYSDKKNAVFLDNTYMKAIAELIAYSIVKAKRGVLVYIESTQAQENLADMLRMYGLRVGVLNTNTKKKETKEILEGYDKKEYDLIIGGTSLSAGISLYRLSLVVDLNLRLNKNNLIQLNGRLKRYNKDICVKNKIYLKVTTLKLSDYTWESDKECLREFDYIKFNDKIDCNIDGLEMIKSLKDILI